MALSAVSLLLGDCIPLMAGLSAGSVDMVLCDLPYGVTDCRWDTQVPMAPLWFQYNRIVRENGAVLLFAQQPFTAQLASQALGGLKLRYEWIWDKRSATGFQNANRMPMRRHESILVFYRRLPVYHPQGLSSVVSGRVRRTRPVSEVYSRIGAPATAQRKTGYPQSIIAFHREAGAAPCQKPVALLEYLIRTYSDGGDTILDNCMGTGSTGVAAVQTGRKFIGMEMDRARFAIASKRIAEAKA